MSKEDDTNTKEEEEKRQLKPLLDLNGTKAIIAALKSSLLVNILLSNYHNHVDGH